MTQEEAKEYAKHMTFRDAVANALDAKCVPYRKATKIKLIELLDFIENFPFIKYENGQWDIDMEMTKIIFQKGHWISHYDEDEKVGWYECDRCHTERAFNTKFCPDCGAKMR